MINNMSAIAEESRREFKRCAKDFVTCMNKEFSELDIYFSSATRLEFHFVFGPTWPKCLRGGLFCSMYIRDFEKACIRGLAVEGDSMALLYEWNSADADFLSEYYFCVRDVVGFHYNQDHLDIYNAYGTIYGFSALKAYAEEFRIAANIAELSAAHIKSAVLTRNLSTTKKEAADDQTRVHKVL